MERKHGLLKEQPRECQREACNGQRGVHDRLQPRHEERQGSRAGESVEVTHPEEHHPGRHNAEDDVLDGRFHLDALARALAAHRHQEIERERRQFEADDGVISSMLLTSVFSPSTLIVRNR